MGSDVVHRTACGPLFRHTPTYPPLPPNAHVATWDVMRQFDRDPLGPEAVVRAVLSIDAKAQTVAGHDLDGSEVDDTGCDIGFPLRSSIGHCLPPSRGLKRKHDPRSPNRRALHSIKQPDDTNQGPFRSPGGPRLAPMKSAETQLCPSFDTPAVEGGRHINMPPRNRWNGGEENREGRTVTEATVDFDCPLVRQDHMLGDR